MSGWQSLLPEHLHDPVRAAFAATEGAEAFDCLGPVAGGASGAVAMRLRSGARDYLLRVEVHKLPTRNPHQYRCMTIAAEAGIAPSLHYCDADHGIALMDFIHAVPLDQFPGGMTALASTLGDRVRQLQATTAFPELWDFRLIVGRLLGAAERWFEPGLLDRHRQAYDQLCRAMTWDAANHVSSHNDPNARNLLFDGARLWLIDWETSFRNDPFVDIAILADTVVASPDLKRNLLEAWLGRAPTADEALRLGQVTLLTRLYYAGLLFAISGVPAERLSDLSAPSPAEFAAQLAPNAPVSADTLVTLGKMRLHAFADGWAEMSGKSSA